MRKNAQNFSKSPGIGAWTELGARRRRLWSRDALAAQSSPSYDEEVIGDIRLTGVNNDTSASTYRVRSIGRVEPESPVENPDVLQSRIQLSHTDAKRRRCVPQHLLRLSGGKRVCGNKVPLYDGSCRVIADVKQDFHDALCVQGSGSLEGGTVVSFAKRGCSCAQVCPRSGQQICFEALENSRFPWGRGAAGKPITPLLTVAVDTDVIPLETSIYIPEFEGLPRDAEGTSMHDGCFIAQDRGFKVRGEHIDVFTGEPALTRLWNRLMPSNRGVTVVLESPKCERARTDLAGET